MYIDLLQSQTCEKKLWTFPIFFDYVRLVGEQVILAIVIHTRRLLFEVERYDITTMAWKQALSDKPLISCDKANFTIVLLNQKVVIWLILPVAYNYLGD